MGLDVSHDTQNSEVELGRVSLVSFYDVVGHVIGWSIDSLWRQHFKTKHKAFCHNKTTVFYY